MWFYTVVDRPARSPTRRAALPAGQFAIAAGKDRSSLSHHLSFSLARSASPDAVWTVLTVSYTVEISKCIDLQFLRIILSCKSNQRAREPT
jgi:hypothetical protein